jgi:hypothetical protein
MGEFGEQRVFDCRQDVCTSHLLNNLASHQQDAYTHTPIGPTIREGLPHLHCADAVLQKPLMGILNDQRISENCTQSRFPDEFLVSHYTGRAVAGLLSNGVVQEISSLSVM